MPIKFKAKTKEEIPAGLQPLYVEWDGGFELDVEGAIDKTKHDEFRALNVALRQQLEDHAKRFEGIDPEAVEARRRKAPTRRSPANQSRRIPTSVESSRNESRLQTPNVTR
jgi:hypothetical protein